MSELVINRAILHVYDFLSGTVAPSENVLNLEDKWIQGYLNSIVRRCHYDTRIQEGSFHSDSTFLKLYEDFEAEGCSFVEYSQKTGEYVSEYLKSTDGQSYDILFVDYRMNESPYIGMYLLENQKAYTHFCGADSTGNINNTIQYHSCVLPSGSRKIASYALLKTISHEVSFCDDTKWTLGDVQVMKDLILACDSKRSHKEVMLDVQEVVSEVAEKCDENPTILLSRYKNYVQNALQETDAVSVEDLAVHVFNDSEKLQDTFISTSMEHDLPQQLPVSSHTVRSTMKNQKIRTDTGIELTFPTEYFENPDLIEFINHPDGTISIEIKKIGKITNRK